jgi:hypothetical protein
MQQRRNVSLLKKIFFQNIFPYVYISGLDGMGRQPPSMMGINYCHKMGNNQLIRLNAAGKIIFSSNCLCFKNVPIEF